MKNQLIFAAALMLSGLLLAPAFAAGGGSTARGGADASGGVTKTQLEVMKKREMIRSRNEQMQWLRARTIAEEIKADEEATSAR